MGTVKGSAFDFHDQGLFYSAIDFGARTSQSSAQNNTAIAAALIAMNVAGGGVLIIPQGIANTFNEATDFPVTANPLMVIILTGNQFQLKGNQAITSQFGSVLAQMFLTLPSAVSLRLVDANPATYTYKFEVYDNAGSPVIVGSSYDLCFFMPGASTPVAAFARAGATPGQLNLFNGLKVTGNTEVVSLKVNGQTQTSKSIQAPLTGTSIQIADTTQYLVLDHAATIAALTVTLPQAPLDGNVVKIYSRSIVTALTLAAGTGETIATGHTVTTIAALGSLEYIYNSSDSKWYRVR